MASTNPHGFIACQDFNALIDRIIGATENLSASRDAALLSVSKLPLVREVLNDMEFTEEAPVTIKGSNAFLIGFRLIKEILGRVEIKLEDRDRASQFRIDLREITSTLDVFDSGLEPTSQPSSSFPKPSRDRGSPTPSLSCKSNDSYCPSRTSSHSSSHTDLPTVSERPVRSVRRYSAKLRTHSPKSKPINKTILSGKDSPLKRRRYDEDETTAANDFAFSKKLRFKCIDNLSTASLLVRRPHTAWQNVEATTSQTDELRRALSFLKTVMSERGILAFRDAWEAYDNVFIRTQKEHIIWPTYLAGRKLPALRRFQEACVVSVLAAKCNIQSPYYPCLCVRLIWRAKKELMEAYKARHPIAESELEDGTIDGHWLAVLDFGQPVENGVLFEQAVYPGMVQERREIFLGDRGQNIVILGNALGHGFFALLSPIDLETLAELNPITLQQAVTAINQDQHLYMGIKVACTEANRLMHALHHEEATRIDNLDRLKSLLAELS